MTGSLPTFGPRDRMTFGTRRYFDIWLFLSAGLLIAVGLMALFSIDRGGSGHYFAKQAVRVAIGLIPALLLFKIPTESLLRKSWLLYGISSIALLAVLAMGRSAKGAQRWLDIGPFDFQPSELAKLFLAITLSAFFASRIDEIRTLRTFLLSLLHVSVPLLLVLAQPHLGGAVTIVVIWLGVSLVAGVPIKFIGASVCIAGGLFALAIWTKALPDYMLSRVEAYTMGGGDNDKRYHQVRALIAFGSGGVSGQGFLKGESRGTGFVPEQQTDYISTVIGEEGGFFGSALLVCAFGYFFYRAWLVVHGAATPFHRMIAAGVFSYLAFHFVANLGMNLELVPVVGLWLPFLSFGGTAIWLCMSSVGLLLNIQSREGGL